MTNYEAVGSSCTTHTYTAGQGFVDAGRSDEHMVRDDTTAPAELIAVQLHPGGSQRRIDEPAPGQLPHTDIPQPPNKNPLSTHTTDAR